jgi:hypothetical protein
LVYFSPFRYLVPRKIWQPCSGGQVQKHSCSENLSSSHISESNIFPKNCQKGQIDQATFHCEDSSWKKCFWPLVRSFYLRTKLTPKYKTSYLEINCVLVECR